MRSVRIAYISQCHLPSQMANSLQVMKMCAAFARRGHTVKLFASRGEIGGDPFSFYGLPERFEVERLDVVTLPGVGGIKFGHDSVREALHAFAADVVYTRHIYGLAWALHAGMRVVYEVHGLPEKRIHSTILGWALGRENLHQVVAISGALAHDIRVRFPTAPPDRVLVAHDGADLPTVDPDVSTELGVSGRRFTVGYVGALYPGKGMEIIAEIAPRLPEMDFHVIGGYGEDLATWRGAALSVANLHLHGFIPHAEATGWLRKFDAVLLPLQERVGTLPGGGQDISRWTSPLKLFEYMAHGRAVVASDLPVLREVIKHSENALMVPPGDIDAWVGALQLLRSDPGMRNRLGAAARATVAGHHTWDRRAELVLRGVEKEG